MAFRVSRVSKNQETLSEDEAAENRGRYVHDHVEGVLLFRREFLGFEGLQGLPVEGHRQEFGHFQDLVVAAPGAVHGHDLTHLPLQLAVLDHYLSGTLALSTRLELAVSGKSRELILGKALPARS